jgi:hypothetical protein
LLLFILGVVAAIRFKNLIFLDILYIVILLTFFVNLIKAGYREETAVPIGISLYVVVLLNLLFVLFTSGPYFKKKLEKSLILIFLISAVIIHGLGSANGMFYMMGFSGGLFALVLIAQSSSKVEISQIIRNSVLGLLVFLIFIGSQFNPYRTENLFSEKTSMTLSKVHESKILVDLNTANNVNSLRVTLEEAGWEVGTPILQLGTWNPGSQRNREASPAGTTRDNRRIEHATATESTRPA